jgi:DNA-binding PadR family transcriptional regulator
MIEHEMLFLGLLVDGPKHGYEIKRKIDEELFPFVGLKVKSIYYPLKKMEQLKLIRKDVGREGKFPGKICLQYYPHRVVRYLII